MRILREQTRAMRRVSFCCVRVCKCDFVTRRQTAPFTSSSRIHFIFNMLLCNKLLPLVSSAGLVTYFYMHDCVIRCFRSISSVVGTDARGGKSIAASSCLTWGTDADLRGGACRPKLSEGIFPIEKGVFRENSATLVFHVVTFNTGGCIVVSTVVTGFSKSLFSSLEFPN